MARFTIVFLAMVVLFMFGVLFGIQQASVGMVKMRGFTDQNFHEAVQTEKSQTGQYEVQVMGKDFQQLSLEQKKQKYQEVKNSHVTEKLANSFTSGVQWLYNKVIFVVYQMVQVAFA